MRREDRNEETSSSFSPEMVSIPGWWGGMITMTVKLGERIAVATRQAQWQKLFGYILGNQAAWIADVGLKALRCNFSPDWIKNTQS